MSTTPSYVLITPARDEAAFIELTIKAVVAQTVRPLKWVIVSDGSTDDTDRLVEKWLDHNPWIELVRMPERRVRHFAGKVQAFNAGYGRVSSLSFAVIGNLDADVSFGPGHFEYLVSQFAAGTRLGVVGAPFREGERQYDYRFANIENVWGGCQLFRRECFEDIGGYVPVKGGCIDHIAVVTARMRGWETRTFTEKVCIHHRQMGTAQRGRIVARFNGGVKDYSVGNHPVWELFRSIYQMRREPLGGLALGAGYAWSMLRRAERPVSSDLVAFTRREQIERLMRLLVNGSAKGSRGPAKA